MPTTLPYFDAPLDEYPTGEVTRVLRDLSHGVVHDDEKLFDAVVAELTTKARAILRGFPSLKGQVDPEELVSEFQVRLLTKLAAVELKDRGHFFALACQHFRWILLDLVKQKNHGHTVLDTGLAESTAGPATRVALRLDLAELWRFVEQELDEEDRQILDQRSLQGLKLGQIAMVMGMPLSTVQHRHAAAIERLRRHFHVGTGNDA